MFISSSRWNISLLLLAALSRSSLLSPSWATSIQYYRQEVRFGEDSMKPNSNFDFGSDIALTDDSELLIVEIRAVE